MTKDEKAVKEIMARYGDTLDLKKSPYVIVEIIRQFGPQLGGVRTACAPPGGPPKLRPDDLIKELKLRAAELSKLAANLGKAVKAGSKG
jgi:hypothetical protein